MGNFLLLSLFASMITALFLVVKSQSKNRLYLSMCALINFCIVIYLAVDSYPADMAENKLTLMGLALIGALASLASALLVTNKRKNCV
ncbi:hypothetical protein [Pseudoalteromonas luteoviolacea]|uniref:hypothetical protein n=1 Tax=Pseudoalteromonas luteoviolacea TaxID=43657 RepID=UPI001B38120B|nr:hypothetical protein [Pseudoalteromonas luteoviolacea]MBQ4839794.1 hypothetical protein [Pseudoalteromonas luteoviolacea]